MTARDAIFARLRAALGRAALDMSAQAALDARLAAPHRNTVPRRGAGDLEARITTFKAEAERAQTEVVRIPAINAVPAAVCAALAASGLPLHVRCSTEPLVTAVPWRQVPELAVTAGRATVNDRASVTAALAGIAETGTLLVHSGADAPSGLVFLPELHIVLLPAAQIVPAYEDAFDALRAATRGSNQGLPRTITLVTGPSRTADVERTLTLGAHGPLRLHVILIDSV